MRILLVVYDNESYIHTFPHGLAYIASALREAHHQVSIYQQDLHHYSDEHLTEYLDNNIFDVVGVSIVGGYYQYHKLLKIADAINKSKHRPLFIIGGHGPSPEPEYFLRKTKADYVVIGEGEETIAKLLECKTFEDSLKVDGIATIRNGQFYQTKRRELIKDIDNIALPAWDLFPISYYRLLQYVNMNKTDFLMPVLSGRGCTFKCAFCYRMDKGFRPRSAYSILDEVAILQNRYRINTIDFADELLMSSVERTRELCNEFIKSGLDFKWHCNGRLNYANKELLGLMKKAGCIFINYGIEAVDNQVLQLMHKGLKVSEIEEGVQNTLEIGISPGLNIMWGNLGDTPKTLKKAVNFLLKYDDCAQLRTIRPMTPYPGCELYYKAIEMGKLKDIADFYENKHTNSDLVSINFTNLSDEQFHKELYNANRKLIYNYYSKKINSFDKQLQHLYLDKDSSFRGFRQF